MSRPDRLRPRPALRRAVLAGACVGVLTAGAVSGSWEEPRHPAGPRASQDAAQLVSRSGDQWSSAYSAEEYEALRLSLEGEYVGTGIAVRGTDDGRIEVSRVHRGSPADAAGIRAGDRLHSVDGSEADGRPVTEVVGALRGSDGSAPSGPGSTVRVAVERGGERLEQELTRELLTVDPVTAHRSAPGVTEVRVAAFVQGSADLVRAAVENAPPGDGVVLDLRGNAGGLIAEAAGVASVFLDGGVVATYDVHGSQRVLHARPGGDTERGLVVLVDGGTMSSAELLAGALRDRNRAVVVGRPTFGKGTVQMPSEQPDGSVAELTVGTYVTPSGTTIEDGRGIAPDLVPAPGEQAEVTARSVLRGLAAGA
ncbi:S41 family peptidase [Streptomyces sp. SM12]|uniref:S41 family peptidase n=1 Tax=Streptomyces sp. SM12 TaxID=1071602 RepID=UPI000CD502F9|nr:S41 family peptidase [Streptomyces sp. SM12]